jgi:hypothetical protein
MSLEQNLKLTQLQNRYAYSKVDRPPSAFTKGYDPHTGHQIINVGNRKLIAKSMQSASMAIGTKVDLVDRFFDFAP